LESFKSETKKRGAMHVINSDVREAGNSVNPKKLKYSEKLLGKYNISECETKINCSSVSW
jgi:uncharacterized protein (UPF0212 family)